MPWRTISLILRGAYYAKRDIDRYAADRPRRRAEKALARARQARKEQELDEIQDKSEAALRAERMALDAAIARLGMKIDELEKTDALGFYMREGWGLTTAYRSYRIFLEGGGRFPADRSSCLRDGRELRRRLGRLTSEDRAYFEEEVTSKAAAARVAAVRSTKRQILVTALVGLAFLLFALYSLVLGDFGMVLVLGALEILLMFRIKLLRWSIK